MTNINKIYHISDIHIKNNPSFIDEYLYVFNNLYKYLEEEKDENSIIVITGDILHVPNNITPETEMICVNFFSKLSNIMTTIIIAGNHDIHVNSDIIIDSLQSILLLRDNELKNVHYLRKSGIYKFGNINFGVNSLIDNKKIAADEILDEGIKICLYHGSIANSKNSNGFEFSGKSITQFDGYDYVLLGDIHNYQYLNDKKTIGYASSLISQTMGECDDYHGVLVWDLENKTSYYKIIENKYRNIQINIEDDIIDIDTLILPENGKIRFNVKNSPNIKIIKNLIQNKYPNITFKKDKYLSNQNIKSEEIEKKTIDYNKIIEESTTNLEIREILNKELQLNISLEKQKNLWKIERLEFDNLFGYGSDNIIDFTKMDYNEIFGLCGNNSIGKSSLIDILCIGLFNNYSRNISDVISKRASLRGVIINNKYKNFKIKLTFIVESKKYLIIKEGIKKDGGTLTYKNYSLIDITKENIILSSQLDDTNKKIIELIGTYDDFCISSILFQSHLNYNFDFYQMTPYERKTFLYKKLNLEYFMTIKDKYILLLSKIKEEFNINEGKLLQINFNNEINITELNILDNEIEELENKITTLTEYLNNTIKLLKPVIENIDINKLLKEKEKINLLNTENFILLKNKTLILNNFEIYQNKYNIKIDKLKIKLQKGNKNVKYVPLVENIILELIENNKNKLQEIEIIKENINKLKVLKNNNNYILKHFYANCNTKCKTCVNNNKIIKLILFSDYYKILEEIILTFENKLKILKITNYDNLLIDIRNAKINNKIQILNDKFLIEKNKIEELNNEIKLDYEYKIKNLELQNNLNIINHKIKLYEENKINITENLIIQEKIEKINIELKELNKQLLDKKIIKLSIEKENENINKKNIIYNELILKQQEIEKKINIYNEIIKLVKPDGIPLKLIQLNLKIIEQNINDMLKKFLNKTIKITDDTKTINVLINNTDGKVCNFFGGMEHFAVSLVFKIYFSKFLNLSSCGILIIDEGVSVFDKNTIQKFDVILDFIKQYYDNIFLITHISSFDDFITTKIVIKKNNNEDSYIHY